MTNDSQELWRMGSLETQMCFLHAKLKHLYALRDKAEANADLAAFDAVVPKLAEVSNLWRETKTKFLLDGGDLRSITERGL